MNTKAFLALLLLLCVVTQGLTALPPLPSPEKPPITVQGIDFEITNEVPHE